MRRLLVLTITLVFVAAMVSAGGGREERVQTVRYWHTMSDPENEQLAKVIAAFEAQNPGIRVDATQYAWDDFRNVILTSVAAGDAPETARLDIIWVPEFAREGWLLPLDDVFPGFESLREEFFPGPLATAEWEGQYYGLPQNTNTQVLLWNRGLFDAHGVAGPPETTEEFVIAAQALSDSNRERYGYALGGTYFWAPAPLFYSMGGQIVDDAMTTAQGYINGEESVRAFTLLVELFEDEALSPNVLGGGIGTADGHGSGRYAMIIDGPWMVDIYRDTYPDFDVYFALVPAGPDGTTSSVVGGENAVMFRNARNTDAAMLWLEHLVSEEAQRTMAQVGVMPTRAGLRGDPAMPEYFDIFMQQLETAQARLPHPAWNQIDRAIDNAFQRMLRGDQSVQSALDQAADEIDRLLVD